MTPKSKPTLEQTIEKAQTLIEALPYIQRFRDTTVVIKLGGRAMIDATIRCRIACDIVMMESFGIHPILVHGGGPEISAMMERVGLNQQAFLLEIPHEKAFAVIVTAQDVNLQRHARSTQLPNSQLIVLSQPVLAR